MSARGCSSMAEHQLPKLTVGVRFPSPAPRKKPWSGQVPNHGSSFWGPRWNPGCLGREHPCKPRRVCPSARFTCVLRRRHLDRLAGLTDLVRKAAAASAPDDTHAADIAAQDPTAWWASHGDGQQLGYSSLLKALAPSPAARQSLLAAYFEPTDDDREEGRKVPGPAHTAIASRARRGSIRVALTTNFDQLCPPGRRAGSADWAGQ